MKIGKKNKKEQQNAAALSKEESAAQDLTKLKKKDLLEIMLKQGEEIDSLRAQVAELQERLDNRIFELNQVGNLAEASLVVTNVFEEAQKAAVIYLNNVKKFANEHYGVSRRGAYDDE
jgi:hypothetical protein